jgi:polysaccharide chain length determinant protein (PEP-CTERM system associated)
MLQALRSGIDVLDVYDDQFTLSFAASDPVSAKMGAERLTELYLSENRRAREVFTQGTQEFLTAELNAVRARLLEQERRVVEYRRRFAGELPSQQPGNLQALQGTQSQLQSLRESLNRDLDRRIVLERSLAEARMQPVAPTPAQPVGAPETATAQLADAQARRRALEARLKPEHPDVQRVAVEIQALERLVRAEAAAAAPTGVAESERDGRIRQLDEDIRILNSQFADKEARATELEAAIAGYHQRIENVPMRESELVELTRDYQATQDLYQRLLGQSEEAQVAANLERQQIAEQFRVLDPARLPERPEGPARDRIVIAGAVLGLFIGVGLLVLIEYRDSSLHTENDVSEALGLPVLASIPIMVSSADRRRMYLGRFARALSASVGLAACLLTVAWSLGHVDWVR